MSDRMLLFDLVLLVPDADMEFALRSLLNRPLALGIREISFDIRRHVQRDAGCRSDCHNYLRLWLDRYRYAMVLFDREGSGREDLDRTQIERDVEDALQRNGWKDRSAVIVVDPEFEAWVWSDSPAVDDVLGWAAQPQPLRQWVKAQKKFWEPEQIKPERPKEALDSVLRKTGKQHSPSIFEDLATNVSVERCVDPAFGKFKQVLLSWFGQKER